MPRIALACPTARRHQARLSADPYANYHRGAIVAFLSDYSLTRNIGSQYEYSNLGMALLGQAFACHAGTDYEELVRRNICKPLAMESTWIVLPKEPQVRKATPYDTQLNRVSFWNLRSFAGAGGLSSDVDDMLLFLAANMHEPRDLTPP